jgi:hypothetical protein
MNAELNEKIPFWGKNFIFYIYSALLGIVGALGFYCAIMCVAIEALNEVGRSPIAYPFSITAGFMSLFICIGIFTAYVANFKYMTKRVQAIFHLLTALAVFVGGVFMWSFLHTVISEIIRPY